MGAGAFASEAAIVAVLYAAWQYAGKLSVTHTEGAADRARWIWDLERALWLPDEAATQAAILGQSWLDLFASSYREDGYFYLNRGGREWITGFIGQVLSADGIEMVPLDWGDTYRV